VPEAIRARKCPICGVPVDWKTSPTRPFCSERCKLIDLGAWASGRYAIPGKSVEHEGGTQASEPSAGVEGSGGDPPPEQDPENGSRRA
jgi:endogenous inhibitor of DNA gyrase (YacG/DUF329 family)